MAKKSSRKVKVDNLPVPVNPYRTVEKVKSSITFQAFQENYPASDQYLDVEGMERLLLKFGYSTTWVYIAVRRIADAVSQIPVYPVEIGKNGERDIRIVNYDFGMNALVQRPNPWQMWSDFSQAIMISLELTGNAYIELAYPPNGDVPTEMYALNPSRMTIIPDRQNYIQGYVYSANGKQYPMEPNQIIHIKYHHPMNDFYGFAPLTAARMAVDVDKTANEWNNNFLHRGAWPVGSLETESDIEEDEKKRLQKQIKQTMQAGKDTSGRLLLLTGGLKYNKLAITPKDTDWADARRMSRDEILAIFGVPFAIAGLFSTEQTTARSAGVEQQIKQFYRTTIFPKVDILLSALNLGLAPLFRQNAKFIADYRSVPALQEEVDQEKTRAEALRTLTGAGLSLNKALIRLYPDIDPEPWGDVSWMNQAMMPVSGPEIPELPQKTPASIPIEQKPSSAPRGNNTAQEKFLRLAGGAWQRMQARRKIVS